MCSGNVDGCQNRSGHFKRLPTMFRIH